MIVRPTSYSNIPDEGTNVLTGPISPAKKGIERDSAVGRVMFEAFRSILKNEPTVARLGRIGQMGATSCIQGSNQLRHNRLMHTMDVVRNSLQLAEHGNFSPKLTALCTAVAFAHDIAHLPTSHLIERSLGVLGINRNHDAIRIPRLLDPGIRSRLEPALESFGATYDELLSAMVGPTTSNTRASLTDMSNRGLDVRDSLSLVSRLESDASLSEKGFWLNLLVDDIVDLASYVQRDLYQAHAVQQPIHIGDQLVAEVRHASHQALSSVASTESGAQRPFELTSVLPILQLLTARGYLYQTISCSPAAAVLSDEFSASLQEYLSSLPDQDQRIRALEIMTDKDLFSAIPSGNRFRQGISLEEKILGVIHLPATSPELTDRLISDTRALLEPAALTVIPVPSFCKTLTIPIGKDAYEEGLRLNQGEGVSRFNPRDILPGIPANFDSRFHTELSLEESSSTATLKTVSIPSVVMVCNGPRPSNYKTLLAATRRALLGA